MVSHQPFQTPLEVVQRMGAMQAQDYYAALYAVGLRINPSVEADAKYIEKAIAKKQIVRTWPMRGTLHFVAASDVRWMLNLLTPRVIKGSAGRYRQLELDEAVFSKARNIVEIALQGGRQLTRLDLYLLLEKVGISTSNQRGYHILGHLAQKAIICMGPKTEKQPTFVLLDEWVPRSEGFTQEESLAALAKRYYSSHGPATVYDLATWAGLKVSDARRGTELILKDLEEIRHQGQAFYFEGQDEALEPFNSPEVVWILPAFDEMLCGYRNKTDLLQIENVKSIILKNGIIRPILVAENEAVGTWNWNPKKVRIKLEATLFRKLSKTQKINFRQKAKNLEMYYYPQSS